MKFELGLATETVRQLHLEEPLAVSPHSSIRETFQLMRERSRGSVLVCADDRLLGIFTERDAMRLMAAGAPLDAPIETVMVSDPATITSDATIAAAIDKMSRGGYRRLPVLDASGAPAGLLKVTSIVHYLVEHAPQAIYNLPPKPRTRSGTREGA